MNIFDTLYLDAIMDEVVPKATFFRDRYFPTAEGDIFAADKVLTEYRKGDRKMAAFVDSRAGDIPVDRRGYTINEYTPAFIAPSRILTQDDLNQRGFGEALYAGSSPAKRAAKLLKQDMTDLDLRISRREEWMAVQTMLNNACTMQSYIDANTQGETLYIKFFDAASEHTYTISSGAEWDGNSADIVGDVRAMCRLLTLRGLPAVDLILGSDAADAVFNNDKLRQLLNVNSGIGFGAINEQLTKYDGVVFMGTLNFGGNRLNVFSVDETYVDDSNATQSYFPAKGAMVTAPGCGHMMYGQITQIDFGSSDFSTHVGKRVPKFFVDQDKDTRKLRVGTRPLAAPKNYCPYIYAADVVS